MYIEEKLPVALIGMIGMLGGFYLTAGYLDVDIKQRANDTPQKERLLMYAGAVVGLAGGLYVGSKVV